MQTTILGRLKRTKTNSRASDVVLIKRGVWIYFWLLIIEGVLRKWVLPELSAPLLIVRDPVLLWIYWIAFRSGTIKTPKLGLIFLVSVPIILLACIQVAVGSNTVLIALYGLRSYLLHLPLALVIAEIFTFEDVKLFGKWILLSSVPIAILMLAQYRASPTSWLNAGAGGETGAQIRSAGEHVRASGPFSFATGIICFFPLAQAFLFYAFSRPKTYTKWVLLPSTIAVLIAIPLSASRSLLFVTAAVVVFAVVGSLKSPRSLLKLAQVGAALAICFAVALFIPVIRDSVQTFQDRWENASRSEGDVESVLSHRVLNVITAGFDAARTESWIGEGIGMGSNVASYLQTGSLSFLLAEMEWQRVVLEFGPILGLGFMMFRVVICWDVFKTALRAMRRGSTLSWLLVPATIPFLIINYMEQPTNLGFMVISVGLCFAAAKPSRVSRQWCQAGPPDGDSRAQRAQTPSRALHVSGSRHL